MSNEFRRRDFIKTVGLGTAALASHTPGSVAASSSHPNVLVIHVDQHRFDCLSVTGNPDVKTPHIDALAGDSVLFENSFCPFPVCTPSRYSLLSGQYVHQHGGFTNRSTLSPAIDTFPKLLRAAGYKTKAVGKMHFTPTYLDVGFDEMELSEQDGEGRWDDDYHRFLMQHDLVDRIDLMDQRKEYRNGAPKSYWDAFGAVVSGLPEKYHSTTWVGDRSIDTLNTWDASQPHLLMAGFIKPHHPFDPPAPWHQMYDPDTLTILPGWTEECLAWDYSYSHGYFDNKTLNIPALKRCMAYYYATISQIDHHVGRMIEVLKKKNLYDNTMIIFTSDHGEYMGFHHMLLKGNYLYDPLAKVPLIIKYPNRVDAGKRSTALVNNIDVTTTILHTSNVAPSKSMEGLNLQSDSKGRDIIFSGRTEMMARTKTHKLLLPNRPNLQSLYFDLAKDPHEKTNLYTEEKYKDDINQLKDALAAWQPDSYKKRNAYLDPDAPQIQQPNVPPRTPSYQEEIIQYFDKKMAAS